jgi:ornithine cyclodeaminase/alanine dehydrogenase-like protein (mu-crystallin family)
MDGNEITSRRTVAASALAASFLARPDSETLLVVGAGRVASLAPEAMRVVLKQLKVVEVWNLYREEAAALVQRLNALGFNAKVSDDLAASARRADVISCATLSTAPLILASYLKPGAHLDLIGSFTPAMTEAEPECFARASVYSDTMEAVAKSGDIINAVRANKFDAAKDHKGTLADLCRGTKKGRTSRDQVTLFKSVGTALEDLAAAELVFDSKL